MATHRLTMRNIKEILRYKWVLQRSHREVAQSLGISAGVVGATLRRASEAGLTQWAEVQELDEELLELRLYGERSESSRPLPDYADVHAERSRPGVTLALLHLEYLEQHPDGYQYTRFCDHYRDWLKKRRLSMRQVHKAGEKMFIDFAGQQPQIVDPKTGEVTKVELFVAVLGASSYTYAEALPSQKSVDWIGGHVHALEYFGGSPRAYVPDNLKSAVTKACRYEPVVNRTYNELARHYGAAILPARPYKPKDKAKAEVAVQIAERWILAAVRNERFSSLNELNARIFELLERLNDRPMRAYNESRRELFERLDKPQLLPLPSRRFEYVDFVKCTVHIDYHVEVFDHYYSVPYELRISRKHLEARVTATTVEILASGKRVTSHQRSYKKYEHTTNPEHMPKAHREHMEWTPRRMCSWASNVGPNTEGLVTTILKERRHPEQGYRSCLGILRLSRRYTDERLEVACGRALAVGARSYRHVERILKNGLDRLEDNASAGRPPIVHDNIRGKDYYH